MSTINTNQRLPQTTLNVEVAKLAMISMSSQDSLFYDLGVTSSG